jgi:hypothetical protein
LLTFPRGIPGTFPFPFSCSFHSAGSGAQPNPIKITFTVPSLGRPNNPVDVYIAARHGNVRCAKRKVIGSQFQRSRTFQTKCELAIARQLGQPAHPPYIPPPLPFLQ